MSENQLLVVTPDERKRILEALGKNEESLADDVKILRDWVKAQKHLPEVTNDKMIENFFLNNKCCFERSKERIDMYYTIRGVLPELFNNKNPNLSHMREIFNIIYMFPLPKLADLYRVFMMKLNKTYLQNLDNFDTYNFFAMAMNIAEVRFWEDCVFSTVLIYDLDGVNLGLLKKFTLIHLKKATTAITKVFNNRVHSIHYVNVSNYAEGLLAVIKTMMSVKISERIHIHKSTDELIKVFPKHVMPKDYGGDEKSLDELQEMWINKFEDYQERYDTLENLKVNEDFRPTKLVNDEVLGFYGNFKQLSVD